MTFHAKDLQSVANIFKGNAESELKNIYNKSAKPTLKEQEIAQARANVWKMAATVLEQTKIGE